MSDAVTIRGKVVGCGWISDEGDAKKGSFFLIQHGRKITRCIKDKGVYDPRQFELLVEVTGEFLGDMLVIKDIHQIEEL